MSEGTSLRAAPSLENENANNWKMVQPVAIERRWPVCSPVVCVRTERGRSVDSRNATRILPFPLKWKWVFLSWLTPLNIGPFLVQGPAFPCFVFLDGRLTDLKFCLYLRSFVDDKTCIHTKITRLSTNMCLFSGWLRKPTRWRQSCTWSHFQLTYQLHHSYEFLEKLSGIWSRAKSFCVYTLRGKKRTSRPLPPFRLCHKGICESCNLRVVLGLGCNSRANARGSRSATQRVCAHVKKWRQTQHRKSVCDAFDRSHFIMIYHSRCWWLKDLTTVFSSVGKILRLSRSWHR